VFWNGDVVTEKGVKRIARGKMCPVERGTECCAHIFKCSEKQGGGRGLLECGLSRKWLNVTAEVTYRSVVRSSTELRSVRKFLYNVGCKLENNITNPVLGVQEEDMEKLF
jgi:hypothetical protein